MDVDLFGAFDEAPQAGGASSASSGANASHRSAAASEIAQYSKSKRASDAAEVAQREVDALAAKRAGKRAKMDDSHTTVADLEASGDRLTTKISVESVKDCVHEVAVPPGYDYVPLSDTRLPDKMAKEYKFVLDPFQKQAVHCIERTESVLVAAHTSAGKTVVAEYAIALSLRDHQRVIYTSPIKALSNQKFRELQEEFSDVGLMTGDVTINPSASCLVMTTEILRSMMYRGSEVMREVGWVIFDEVHYMRDKERGVVWEETMILLPHQVHFVFLSATIPNALQFARWIAELHNQPCHVVYTEYRPTPLMHYLFPSGGDGLHLVVDERGDFREESFMRAMAAVADKPAGKSGGKGRGKKGNDEIMNIISTMMKRNLNPILVFSFSKRDCEKHALTLSKLDFNDDEEKALIDTVFTNAMDALSEEDRKLPQVELVLPLLKRGIGIHHGGLLPILKEVIEILFGEGLVKVLFATETFAMGLNMPAKTVIFTGVRKFDGQGERWVTSGEYIQMSGRAGRRGLDDRGLVILMCDEKMEPSVGRGILRGLPDKLNSAYHLTYHTVLNLLVQEDINPETILQKSFFQFQNQQALPQMERKLSELTAEHSSMEIEEEDSVSELFDIQQQLRRLSHELQLVVSQPTYAVPFLQAGRLVKVRDRDVSWGWGVVVNFSKKRVKSKRGKKADGDSANDEQQYVVEVLLKCATGAAAARSVHPLPCVGEDKGEMKVIPVLLALIEKWSSARLFLPKDIRPLDARQSVGLQMAEISRRMKGDMPLLHPVDDMKIPKRATADILTKIRVLEDREKGHALYGQASAEAALAVCARKRELAEEIKALKKQLRKSNSIIKLDELKARKRVLRRLDFASSGDVISLKGRVACCVSTGDELVLTELIFNGVFNDLGPEECCALGSAFVFDERIDTPPKPPAEVESAIQAMQDTARRLCKVYTECKMEVDETEYVESFNIGLVPVAYAWAKGASFLEVSKMTDVFEGSIIRVMRRLEELLRQLAQAAKAIGNTELEQKFASAISLIKRDIIFHPSLYL